MNLYFQILNNRLEDCIVAARNEFFTESTKVMRKLIALRKRKPDAIAEEWAVLEVYGNALGMENVFG